MTTIKEYLDAITPEQRSEYERIKAIVYEVTPDAEETISYGMPTFKYKGKPLLYFGAFKNHMSVFPTPEPVLKLQAEGKLTNLKVSKGTVQFANNSQLPKEIIQEMIKIRLDTILGLV